MPDFITELPNEIATEILNHLSQAECIKCMRVCQQWYHQIPNLSNSVWKELTISVTCWDTVNECMLLCLGPHVKSVSILEHDTCAILNKLYEKSCIITSLEIKFDPYFILDNDLRHIIPNVNKLTSIINQFSNTMIDLTIIKYPYNLSVLQLLRDFPHLTYLTLQQLNNIDMVLNSSATSDETNFHDPPPMDTTIVLKSNVRYLYLSNITNSVSELLYILNYCPQLRSLICKSNSALPEFKNIFDICPYIQFLSWNEINPFVYRYGRMHHWKQISVLEYTGEDGDEVKCDTNEEEDTTFHKIHELIFFGKNMVDFDHAFRLIKNSRSTLNHLELRIDINCTIQWDSIARTKFPNIKSLILRDVAIYNDGWIDIIGHCENLEQLDIIFAPTYEFESFDRLIKDGISSLQQLRYLRLQSYFRNGCSLKPGISENFDLLSTHCQHLETVHLHNMCINDKILLDLSKIRSLRSLNMSAQFHKECASYNGLLDFANNLITINPTSSNTSIIKERGEEPIRSSIEYLVLDGFTHMHDHVMERMAQVDSLLRLNVFTNNHITDTGVKSFLQNSFNMNSKKVVQLLGCPGVSREGIWDNKVKGTS